MGDQSSDTGESLRFASTPAGDFEAARARATVREALFGEADEGARIGRYVLLEIIGSGGMGVVYAALDTELDRKVALKLVRSARGAQRKERLLREAKAMAKLSHPNVVTVYEAGTHDGEVFYAMEFVQGSDLRQWLKGTQRSWREILAVLIDAGAGLCAAHDAGIVHRDLKPANIFVGDDGRVRVGDFGLARSVDEQSSTDARLSASDTSLAGSSPKLTRTGALLGTPAYLAPENGDGRPANELSDQFSFCVTAYESLFGTRPFVGASLEAILEAAREGRMQSPSAPRQVPTWLRRVIVRGLAADPSARYRSMQELIGELRRDRARRWRRVGFAGAAVAAAGAAWMLGPRQAPRPCSGSEAVFAEVWDAGKAEQVRRDLSDAGMGSAVLARLLERIDDYGARFVEFHNEACVARRVRGETTDTQFAMQTACLSRGLNRVGGLVTGLSRADAEVAANAVESVAHLPALEDCRDLDALSRRRPVPDDEVVRARVGELRARLDEAEALQSLRESEVFGERLQELLVEADALGYQPFRAEVLASRARSLGGAPSAADLEGIYEALYVAEAAGNDEAAVSVWHVLVQHYTEIGEFEEARRKAGHADALIRRLGEPPSLRRRWHNVVGNSYGRERKDYDAAIEHFEQAIALTDEGSVNRARLQGNLANIYASLERNELALSMFEQARATALDDVGVGHSTAIYLLFNVARMKSRVDQIDESNAMYLDVIPQIRQAEGPASTMLGYAQNNLGQNYAAQGHMGEAVRWIKTGIATLEARTGKDHPSLVRPLRGLANLYIKTGDADAARPVATRALEIAKATIGPRHPDTAYAMRRLAQVELLAGDHRAARALLDGTLEIIDGTKEPEIEYAITWFDLARALWPDSAQQPRALQLAKKAHAIALAAPHEDEKEVRYRSWLEAHGGQPDK